MVWVPADRKCQHTSAGALETSKQRKKYDLMCWCAIRGLFCDCVSFTFYDCITSLKLHHLGLAGRKSCSKTGRKQFENSHPHHGTCPFASLNWKKPKSSWCHGGPESGKSHANAVPVSLHQVILIGSGTEQALQSSWIQISASRRH